MGWSTVGTAQMIQELEPLPQLMPQVDAPAPTGKETVTVMMRTTTLGAIMTEVTAATTPSPTGTTSAQNVSAWSHLQLQPQCPARTVANTASANVKGCSIRTSATRNMSKSTARRPVDSVEQNPLQTISEKMTDTMISK